MGYRWRMGRPCTIFGQHPGAVELVNARLDERVRLVIVKEKIGT
jgi:hypothetical protein